MTQAPAKLPVSGLRAGGRDFPLESVLLEKSATQSINELTVGRRSADHPAPDIGLGDLPDGRTVSRRHARLTRREDEWYLRVEDGTSNPTQVDGQTVAPGEEIALSDGQQIALGGVALRFYEPNPIEIVEDDRIGLSLEPMAVWAAPGSEREAIVTLSNFTNSVESFRVEVVGLPVDWYQLVLPRLAGDAGSRSPHMTALERVDVRLFQTQARGAPASDAVGRVHILFTPPRTSSALAGEHPFTVRVTSRATRLRRELRAKLILEPFRGLALQQLPLAAPPRVRGVFEWQVHNTGNAASIVTYTARAGAAREGPLATQLNLLPMDEEGGQQEEGPSPVAFVWATPQSELQAGARSRTRLTAAVRRQPWWGDARTYPFMVTATADVVSVSDRAFLHCPPRVSPHVQGLLRWLIGRWPFLLVVVGVILLILPAQVDLTVADRIVGESPVIARNDRVTEVAAGDEVWIKLLGTRAAAMTVDAAVYDHLPDAEPCEWDIGPFPITGHVCEYWKGSDRWLVQYPLQDVRYVIHGTNIIGLPGSPADWPLVVHQGPIIDAFESSASTIAREGDPIKLKWKVHAGPNDDLRLYVRRVPAQPGAANGPPVDTSDPCTPAQRIEGKNRLLFGGMWFDANNGGVIATLHNVCHWALAPNPAQIVVGNVPHPLRILPTDSLLNLRTPLKPGDAMFICTCGDDPQFNQALAEAFQRPGTPVTVQALDGTVVASSRVPDQVYPPTDAPGALDAELAVQPQAVSTDYELEVWSRWTRGPPTLARRTITVMPPTVDALTVSPASAVSGGEVRLEWSAKGASALTLFGSTVADADGDVLADSDTPGLLTSTGWSVAMPTVDAPTDYWLTLVADNVATRDPNAARVLKKVRVSVVPSQTFMRAEPDTLTVGDSTTLIWQADQALAVRVEPGVGDVPPGPGRAQLKPVVDTEYALVVTGLDGVQTRKTVGVRVQPLPEPTPSAPPAAPDTTQVGQAQGSPASLLPAGPPRIDFFQAAPASVESGQPTRLVLSVHGAQQVTVRDANGKIIAREDLADPAQVVRGVDVTPLVTTIYVLTATTPTAEVTQPLTIEVHPPAPAR